MKSKLLNKPTLLDDTLYHLYNIGYKEDKVEYVSSYNGVCASNWTDFAKQALHIPYDELYIENLVIMLKNGSWFERHFNPRATDEKIKWYFISAPTKPENPLPLDLL